MLLLATGQSLLPALGAKGGAKTPPWASLPGVHWEIEEMNPGVFKLFMLGGSFVQVCLAHVKCRLRSQGREQSHFRGPPGGQVTETSRPGRQGSEDPGCAGGCLPQAPKRERNLLARTWHLRTRHHVGPRSLPLPSAPEPWI